MLDDSFILLHIMSSWVMLGTNGCNKGTLWSMAIKLSTGVPCPQRHNVHSAGGGTVVLFVSPKNISLVFVYYIRLTPFPLCFPSLPPPHFLPRKETQNGSGSIVWKEEDSRRDAQTKPKSTQQGQNNHVHIFTCIEGWECGKESRTVSSSSNFSSVFVHLLLHVLNQQVIRELDRERTSLERQEKKLVVDIKKMAKSGQMEAVKIMAKDLVRTRNFIKKFILMRANIQAIALKVQTLKSQAAMANAMKGWLHAWYNYWSSPSLSSLLTKEKGSCGRGLEWRGHASCTHG